MIPPAAAPPRAPMPAPFSRVVNAPPAQPANRKAARIAAPVVLVIAVKFSIVFFSFRLRAKFPLQSAWPMPSVIRSSILIFISILLVGPSIFRRFPLLLFLSLTTLVCPDPTPVWIRVPLSLAAVSAPAPIRGKKPVCSQQANREKNARNTEQGLLHHEESPLLLVNRARGVPT